MIPEKAKGLYQKVLQSKHRNWILFGLVLLAVMILSGIFSTQATQKSQEITSSRPEKKIKYWTCSMHPQINLPKPGLCPICAMDLIPVYEGGGEEAGSEVSLTLNAVGRQLAEIETEAVRYESVSHEIRLVGKVEYDETRLSYISAWVPGRIDELYVDFTGTRVRKGDHLIKIYSPELISAQEEYIQAIRNLEETRSSELGVMRQTAQSTLKSSRDKLRLFGITEKQIEEIEKAGRPREHLTIYSSGAGTVIQKSGFEGMYVKTGDKIYAIADLSKVWLYLDAYESDIQWLHYGQPVVVEAESYPGEIFHGKVAFIEPFVDQKSRTIKLRVNVDNTDEKLKPGMFVRAMINATVGEDGKIYEEDLAGKWICPMHPDVIKDQQAPCDICGMDLIRTSEFGFSDKPATETKALVIPKSAPLITGKRAVVYVENMTDKTGVHRYEGREVVLGPRAGDHYIVLSGVREGEKVVTKGNFKIDSALQIQAMPSMMNPAGYYSEKDNVFSSALSASPENAGILREALPYYLDAYKALAHDDPHKAAESLTGFKRALDRIIPQNQFDAVTRGLAAKVKSLSRRLENTGHDLGSSRGALADISAGLKDILEKYEYKEDLTLYQVFCPMAFDGEGGYWFQDSETIANPYFGSEMLECGDVQKTFGREITRTEPQGSVHQH
jgi:Cu(I)/Ag(I) efflux system membrane fusion protein